MRLTGPNITIARRLERCKADMSRPMTRWLTHSGAGEIILLTAYRIRHGVVRRAGHPLACRLGLRSGVPMNVGTPLAGVPQ